MKKLTALLFALTMGLSMVACSSSKEAVKTDAPAEATADANKTEDGEEAAPKKSLKKSDGNRMERPVEDE